MKTPILHTVNLCKEFTKPERLEILNNINLSVHSGEIIAIMGASGEGKSTLLQILGTLEKASSGSVFIDQHQVFDKNAAKIRNQKIGFIFQNFHLLEDYTALQNVLFPAWIARESTDKNSFAYRNALELLGRVGLKPKAHLSTNVLSGGEKQRVAIARALCNDPKILLADEPSGNLDHSNSEKVHQLLFYCAKKLDKGVVVVTHDIKLARLCDRIHVLENGVLK